MKLWIKWKRQKKASRHAQLPLFSSQAQRPKCCRISFVAYHSLTQLPALSIPSFPDRPVCFTQPATPNMPPIRRSLFSLNSGLFFLHRGPFSQHLPLISMLLACAHAALSPFLLSSRNPKPRQPEVDALLLQRFLYRSILFLSSSLTPLSSFIVIKSSSISSNYKGVTKP